MRLCIAYEDETGRIGAASTVGGGGDRPVARPGTTVTELEVPDDLAEKEIHEIVHLLRVDVAAGRLVRR